MEEIIDLGNGVKVYRMIDPIFNLDEKVIKKLRDKFDCEREYKKVLEKVKEYKETERP